MRSARARWTTLDTCVLPNYCLAGSAVCLYTAPSGNIWASPRLVPSGGTGQIGWLIEDAESCTVSGNGDTWAGTSGSRTSNPITDSWQSIAVSVSMTSLPAQEYTVEGSQTGGGSSTAQLANVYVPERVPLEHERVCDMQLEP